MDNVLDSLIFKATRFPRSVMLKAVLGYETLNAAPQRYLRLISLRNVPEKEIPISE